MKCPKCQVAIAFNKDPDATVQIVTYVGGPDKDTFYLPQGAIVEIVPVSSPALRAEIRELRGQAEDAIARIERLSRVA